MSTRRELRARDFGRNLRASPVIRDMTVGQIADIIHAFVHAETVDGKAQLNYTRLARRAFKGMDSGCTPPEDPPVNLSHPFTDRPI